MNSIENSTKGLMKNNRENNLKKIIINYSIIFIVLSLCCYSYFIFNNKLLNWFQDGYSWHITRLIWFSRYLRNIFLIFFSSGKIVIPEYVFSFGPGGDVFEVASYGIFGDPFNLLSIFVPEHLLAYFDHFVAIFKTYLSGVAFIYMCYKLDKQNDVSILTGAIIYVFCGWNLFNIARHHLFLSPGMYFPLLILGIEYIFNGEKPYMYIFTLVLYFITAILFSFHIVILTVVYILIKLIYNKYKFKNCIYIISYLFLFSIVSLLIASVYFVPAIFNIVASGRVGKNYIAFFAYPIYHYEKLLKIIFLPEISFWVLIGIASPALLFIISLFKNNKNRIDLKIYVLITMMFISVPIIGKIFNGGAYINNRYVWYIPLIFAYIVVIEWENFIFDNSKWIYILLFAIYLFICLNIKNASTHMLVIPICIIFIICILLILFKNNIKVINYVIIYGFCFSIVFNANYLYQYKKYINEQSSYEKIANAINYNSATAVASINDKNFVSNFTRYAGSDGYYNDSLVGDISSDSNYSATSNEYLLDYSRFIGVKGNQTNVMRGFEYKTIPYLLNATKYFSCKKDYIVPYGYEYIDNKYGYNIYENKYALDIMYGYDKAISYDEAKRYNVLERQELMLNNIILENGVNNPGSNTNVSDRFANELIDFKIEPVDDNIIINDNNIIVSKKNSKLKINCNMKNNTEKHLIFNNFKYKSLSNYDFYVNKYCEFDDSIILIDPDNKFNFEKLSKKEKEKIQSEKLYFGFGNTQHNINIRINDKYNEKLDIKTIYNTYYSWLDNYDVNLHNYDGQISEIVLTFPNIGVYTFDDISLYCLPMDGIEQYANNLRIDKMDSLYVGNDTVSANIDIDSEKYICLAIPYSKHWKAYIDGVETKVSKANICYMCVNCPSGKHKIEFKYHNKYITYGQVLSVFGVIIFIMMIITSKYNIYKRRED